MASSKPSLELFSASTLSEMLLSSSKDRADTLATAMGYQALPDALKSYERFSVQTLLSSHNHRVERHKRLESELLEMMQAMAHINDANSNEAKGTEEEVTKASGNESKENVDSNLPSVKEEGLKDESSKIEKTNSSNDENEEENEEVNDTSLPILLPKTPSKNKAKTKVEKAQQVEDEEMEPLVRRSTRLAGKQPTHAFAEPPRAIRRTTRLASKREEEPTLPTGPTRPTRRTTRLASKREEEPTLPTGPTRSSNRTTTLAANKRRHVEDETSVSPSAKDHHVEAKKNVYRHTDMQEKEEGNMKNSATYKAPAASSKGIGEEGSKGRENKQEGGDEPQPHSPMSAEDEELYDSAVEEESILNEKNEDEDMEQETNAERAKLSEKDSSSGNLGEEQFTSFQSLAEASVFSCQEENEQSIGRNLNEKSVSGDMAVTASNDKNNPSEFSSAVTVESSNLRDDVVKETAITAKKTTPSSDQRLMASRKDLYNIAAATGVPDTHIIGSGSKFATSKFSFVQKDPTLAVVPKASEDEVRRQREDALKSKEEHRQAILLEQQKLKKKQIEERRFELEEKMRRAEEKRRQHEEEMRNKAIKKQEKLTETERHNKAKEVLVAKEKRRAEEEDRSKREQLSKQRALWEEKRAQLEKSEQQQPKQKVQHSQASKSLFQTLLKKQKMAKAEAEKQQKQEQEQKGADTSKTVSTNLNSTFTISKESKANEKEGDIESSSGASSKARTSDCDSYDITPARHELPPEELEDSQNYDINDLKSDDDTDDEDQPRKKIPSWATGAMLRNAVLSQAYNPPDLDKLFGVMSAETVRLEVIFKEHKKRYFKRTSSACWDQPPMTHKFN